MYRAVLTHSTYNMTEYTFPYEYIKRLHTFLSPMHITTIMASYTTQRCTTFRTNTLKTSTHALYTSLQAKGFMLTAVPWYSDAWIVQNKSLRELTETSEYKHGELYVQSLSSMIPPLILDPKPGEKILDIAAAPGSKTTQIAAIMQNHGELVANDSSRVRGYRLAANITMQGATMARVTQYDARSVWQHAPEYYDRTLVDVPCSMEGRFNMTDPKTFKDWSVKKITELSRLQRWILRSAISATKPGGTIVYSTCTLSPEENEDVIDWILQKEKDKIILENVHIDGLHTDPALHSYKNKTYHANIALTARIYPTSYMEGFYIARLKKLNHSVPEAMRR